MPGDLITFVSQFVDSHLLLHILNLTRNLPQDKYSVSDLDAARLRVAQKTHNVFNRIVFSFMIFSFVATNYRTINSNCSSR